MAVTFHRAGEAHARALIEAGRVDRGESWSFDAADGDRFLGDPPDWSGYGKWFLGRDDAAGEETKAAWKYPVGKGGQVHRAALTAIRQRAAQQNETEIFEAAGRLLERIDERASESEPLEVIKDKVCAALQARYPAEAGSSYVWIEATYPDVVIFALKGQRYRVPYAVSAEGVLLGEPVPAEVQYRPMELVEDAVRITGSVDPAGKTWDVVIIQAGRSKNGLRYTEAVLQAAAPLFEGAKVCAYEYKDRWDHLPASVLFATPEGLVKNVVGDLEGVRAAEGALRGRLNIHDDAQWLRDKLLDLRRRGVLEKHLGLSIDSLQELDRTSGQVKQIHRVFSVDVVTYPAAGGQFERLVASHRDNKEETPMLTRLMDMLRKVRPDLVATLKPEELTEERLLTVVREALAAPPKPGVTPEEQADLRQRLEQLEQAGRVRATQARVAESLNATTLPEPVKIKITKRFAGRVAEAAEIQSVVQEEVETLGKLSPTGDVRGFGQGRIEIGAAPVDKVQAAMDRLFDVSPERFTRALESAPFNERTLTRIRESLAPNAEAHKDRGLDFQGSLRRAYAEITGDPEVTGRLQRVSETIASTTWGDILGNTLYRRLLQDYAQPRYNEGSIAEFGRAADFRTKEAIVQHYFGDLSDVDPELADYLEIAAPGDDKVSYAVGQKGNILTITRKTIINDDLGAVSRLVGRLGRAARRTLARFIWNFHRNNSVYDVDALAWFHANHGNTGATALTADLTGAAEVLAKIIQLADMTEEGSAEKLGLPAIESLWLDVPHALYGVAVQINNSMEFGAGNVNPVFKHFGQTGERINVNPLFTDATDWGVHVSPGAGGRPSVGVDFLQGREEPEFFLAEQPTVGQAFLGDKIQYKIRHEYGGDILGVKGATKNVVAG